MAAVERGAELIFEIDLRNIEPAAAGNRERRRHVDRIGQVKPGIGVERFEIDRRDLSRRLGNDDAGARDEQIGADRAQLARRVEIDMAAIEACSDHEPIFVTEHAGRMGGLGGATEAVRSGRSPVDRPGHGAVENVGHRRRVEPE